ncbi:hypothetical protein C9J48_10970 [Photobacterium profundum]|uniref:Uncharacterized protein n=1 Tax=Photobacterium profundum 3TCK TaxID=314280 RepID=Q1YWV7_9GAMM|nr:hypothetical protein [Photobacterium profundum]EAS40745.1 hypothetical protein P3TCK_08663 [Photobacterium profundum 3TCK]PSV62476.1 hypothetical protein C9J48_10970 [Photobacterium profundum]
MKYKGTELESIQLKAVVDSLDDMVNHSLMEFSSYEGYTAVTAKSLTHKEYFNIMLVDFLSNLDGGVFGQSISCLRVLRNVCKSPCFNINNSTEHLKAPVDQLKDWLEEVVTVDVWFPSVGIDACFKVRRIDFIKICGNICKHGLGRLTKTARGLQKIFKDNGFHIDDEQSLLALSDFHEKFHDDILSYHLSHISEMLNNIRWGIQMYLLPEYESSHHWVNRLDGQYAYHVPKEINSQFSQNSYWELMNLVRRQPNVKQFKARRFARIHY